MSNPIKIKPIGPDQFEGVTDYIKLPRYYGGEIMAQAVLACAQTIKAEIFLHSINCTFLKEGSTELPLIHHIKRLKDAKHFSVRQVDVMQENYLISTMILSYQLPEKGPEHQTVMPNVPKPEDVESHEDIFLKEAPPDLKRLNPLQTWPTEFREVNSPGMFHPVKKPPHSAIWFKSKEKLDDDPVVQQAMLVFASDTPILAVAMRPHSLAYWAGNVQPATLSHYLWFHRPCRADEWLLFNIESPVAAGGRGIAYGNIFDMNGNLVATSMQDGLIRPIQ